MIEAELQREALFGRITNDTKTGRVRAFGYVPLIAYLVYAPIQHAVR